MADVFISYSKAERRHTEELADDLQTVGLTVWWDTSILPGDQFKDIILRELGEAKAAIVIWTRTSINSAWVYSEAQRASRQQKLISVREPELDIYDVPPPFDAMHTDLIGNRGAIFSALEKLGLSIDKNLVANISPLDLQEKEAVRWLEIRQSADEEAFREFLSKFPSGGFRSKAEKKLDSIVWSKILASSTVERLNHYLDQFPNGAYRLEAVERAAKLRLNLRSLRSVVSEAYQEVGEPVPGAVRVASPSKVTRSDDLKRIRGIGVLVERKLNALGIVAYGQIAGWTEGDIDRISQALDFKGRIEREGWVEQARILAAGGDTEFSRRLDRRDGDGRPKS